MNSTIPRWLPLVVVLLAPLGSPAQSFTDVAAALGFPNSGDATRGMAWADYDGDGDLDVYLQNQGGTSRLLRNDGVAFTDVTALMGVSHASSGWSAAWGDYDNDGRPDLYLGNFQANNCFRNNFPAAFLDLAASNGAGDTSFAQSVAWVDHDQDGDLDLYVTMEFDPHRFFENVGNGMFTDVTSTLGLSDPQSHSYGLTWGDFDGDGDPDCFVSTCGAGTINRLFRNNQALGGPLLYTEIGALAGANYQPNTYGTEWVDLDDDGDLDLFVVGAAGEPNHLYRNDGTLPLVDVALQAGVSGPLVSGRGCDFGDYDNDGRVDIFAHDAAGPSRLYRNLGGLSFALVPNAAGAENPSGGAGFDCAMIDFDNDGDLDIHIATSNRDRLYRNSGNANRWLQVEPRGTRDNRAALGARVEIVTQGASQSRLISNGAGAFSQNLVPAHFGLGSHLVVDSVTVHWPDGSVDTLTNVASNQKITITQSSGQASVTTLGIACMNTLGQAALLTAVGLPTLGNPTFSLRVSSASAGLPASLFLAQAPAAIPFDAGNGCTVYLDPASLIGLLQLGLAPYATGTTGPSGVWSIPLAIPPAPWLLGTTVPFQALLLDPNGPGTSGFTLTNGLSVRVGL